METDALIEGATDERSPPTLPPLPPQPSRANVPPSLGPSSLPHRAAATLRTYKRLKPEITSEGSLFRAASGNVVVSPPVVLKPRLRVENGRFEFESACAVFCHAMLAPVSAEQLASCVGPTAYVLHCLFRFVSTPGWSFDGHRAPAKAKKRCAADVLQDQSFIDAGQKELYTVCSVCDMPFVPGVEHELHSRHCGPTRLRHVHNSAVVRSLPSGAVAKARRGSTPQDQVVSALPGTKLWTVVTDVVKRRISDELGDGVVDVAAQVPDLRALLYRQSGSVVGCLLYQLLPEGTKLQVTRGVALCESTTSDVSATAAVVSGGLDDGAPAASCVASAAGDLPASVVTGSPHVGVRVVWVDGSCRRRGVALELLAAAMEVIGGDSRRVAFAQPTPAGYGLARRFVGSPDVLTF